METAFHKFIALTVLPMTDTEDVMFNFSRNLPSAEKLDMVELPPRPKLIPFKDELACAPTLRGVYGWFQILLYLACALLAYYGMWYRSADYSLTDQLAAILKTGSFPSDPNFALKRSYTGIVTVDSRLAFLSAAFMAALTGWDESFSTLHLYFLGMLIQPIAIYSIEAFRKRNAMTLLALYETLTLPILASRSLTYLQPNHIFRSGPMAWLRSHNSHLLYRLHTILKSRTILVATIS